jgi:hypothetical protein
MVDVKISDGIEGVMMISDKTIGILRKAGEESNNGVITITSGIRSSERQANAMYVNLANGKRIRYAAPGMEVTRVYDESKGLGREECIRRMVVKIEELQGQGKLVSRHCVSEAAYRKRNVVDVSGRIPNPRDFVVALMGDDSVVKVITPFSSSKYGKYGSRVSVDGSEGAIHCEINQ